MDDWQISYAHQCYPKCGPQTSADLWIPCYKTTTRLWTTSLTVLLALSYSKTSWWGWQCLGLHSDASPFSCHRPALYTILVISLDTPKSSHITNLFSNTKCLSLTLHLEMYCFIPYANIHGFPQKENFWFDFFLPSEKLRYFYIFLILSYWDNTKDNSIIEEETMLEI